MTLTLRVLQTPRGVGPVAPRRIEPGARPFAIGRGRENDWVLEDPDRHISKVHCRIEWGGDGFDLVDTSSNGVFFAAESKPVGRGRRRPIDSGDSFRIGDYRIAVAREAAERLPALAEAAPVAGEGVLGGIGLGVEIPASRSVAGEAGDWLGGLPSGSVDAQVVQPLGWYAPPATALTAVPDDVAQPLSDFASLSEHVPAVNGALQVGGAKPVLPADWNLGAEPVRVSATTGAAGPDWPAAQAALLDGAALAGLLGDAPLSGRDREVLVRSGRLLRRLVDALAAAEAVQRTAERELGLSEAGLPDEDLPGLLAAALWTADPEATDALVHRVSAVALHARALALAVADAAGEVGAQIHPEALEEAAQGQVRLAVGPLLRAASWERYCAVHANLAGAAGAPAADAVLAPLRRAFHRRA